MVGLESELLWVASDAGGKLLPGNWAWMVATRRIRARLTRKRTVVGFGRSLVRVTPWLRLGLSARGRTATVGPLTLTPRRLLVLIWPRCLVGGMQPLDR